MSFLSSLFPQTVLRTSSRYNSDICVIREWGGHKLLVNGSRQSGPYIRKLWERAFRKFRLVDLQDMHTIVVLGVGGGTVIELLAKRFPAAAITAVDIDPTMIAIAKQYFGIERLPNVRLVGADAKIFVEHCSKKGKVFDLVIVDLFIGREIPAFVATERFYKKFKHVTSPRGAVVINYLREREYQKKSEEVMSVLQRIFFTVRDYSIANNRFFFAST